MNKKYDYLIVGAGLYGSTFAYIATQKGKKCLVLDRRNQVGGNLFCLDVNDIDVHYYGVHIFHTSDDNIWNFITSLVTMDNYVNSPMAKYKDEYYNLPFNLNTICQLFGKGEKESLKKWHNEIEEAKMLIGKPKNLFEEAVCLVGNTMFEKLIRGYTEKQWGRKCEELPTGIITRIPVRENRDNNYYNDKYQGIPKDGYNSLISKLLEGSDVILNTDFNNNKEKWLNKADKIVYTGCIDEYFDNCYGKLDYRSLKFEHKIYNEMYHQNHAVLNRTDSETKFTRSIEHKLLSPKLDFDNFTVVSYEYPSSEGEPYYPINDEQNTLLYNRYKELADKEKNVIFGGRLAEYKYYDMDDIIKQVLNIKEQI